MRSGPGVYKDTWKEFDVQKWSKEEVKSVIEEPEEWSDLPEHKLLGIDDLPLQHAPWFRNKKIKFTKLADLVKAIKDNPKAAKFWRGTGRSPSYDAYEAVVHVSFDSP